jgi:FkbM family methyltransferase
VPDHTAEPTTAANIMGTRFVVSPNPAWEQISVGQWEPTTLAAIQTLLARGGCYIDVGAWIGPTVLAGAQYAFRVVAYEPDPRAADELRRNVALNNLKNVEIRELALFDRTGKLPFGPGEQGALGQSTSSLVIGDSTTTVLAVDAREEARLPHFIDCTLLKIDVEGAEFSLIPRLAAYLARYQPPILLSVHTMPVSFLRHLSQRARMFWHLRRYRYVYVDKRPGWTSPIVAWHQITWLGRALLPLTRSGRSLLFSMEPVAFSSETHERHGGAS